MPLLQDKLVAYLTPAKALKELLARPGFTQRRIEPVDVRLDLLATALVDNFPSHHLADVGHAIAGRNQLALHVVDAFAEDYVDPLGALVQDHDLDGLSALGAYLDFLVAHAVSILHEGGQLRRGQRTLEITEAALFIDLPCRLEQAAHRRAIQRTGEADPPHAGRRELGDAEGLAFDAGHEVDRLGQRGAHRAYGAEGGEARRHQHVPAPPLARLQSL